ncbi:MAG: T9SS type A sorting domain-containing protein [Saprospiraceae bacterium]|jgi:hypothetical protein
MKTILLLAGIFISSITIGQIKLYETYRYNPSCNVCNGEVIIGFTGVYTPYYAYITENGSTRQRFGPFYGSSLRIHELCAKSYLLEIYDACGCYGKYNFNLSSGTLSATVTTTNANCNNPNGTITINVGNSNYYNIYYRRYDESAEKLQYLRGPNIPLGDFSPGTYYLRVKDSNGCEKSLTAVILSQSFSINTTILNASCNNNNGTIQFNLSGGQLPYNIEWYGPTSDKKNSFQNSFSIFNLPAGTYTIVIRDNKGCSNALTIVIGTINTINPVFKSGISDCDGNNGSIDIMTSGANLPYTITYSGQGINGTKNMESTSTQLAGLKSGTYKIVITDARGCKVENFTDLINGFPWIQLESITLDNCSSNGSVSATLWRFTSFKLYGSDGKLIDSKSGNGISSPYYKGNLMGGFYTVVIEYNGCTKTYEFEIPSNGPTTTVVNQTPINCATGTGGLIELKISGGKGPYTVQYRHESETGHKPLGDFTSSAYIPTLNEGYYFICIIDQNGCSTLLKVQANITGGPEISQLNTRPSTCYLSNGCIIIKLTTSKLPYIIQLKGPTPLDTFSFSTDFQKCNLLPGDYLITFSDANNCKTQKTFHVDDVSNDIEDQTKLTALKGSGQSILIYNDLVSKGYYVWGLSFCRGNIRIDTILGEGINNIFYYGYGNSDTLVNYLKKNNYFLWSKAYNDELKRGCSTLRYLNGPTNLPCVTSTKNSYLADKILIFPNPASDYINIELGDVFFSAVNFSLFNTTGQYFKIQSKRLNDNQLQLDISALPKGIYFLSIKIGNEKITKKIITI